MQTTQFISFTNFVKCENQKEAIKLATKMIKKNISFDFMNDVEFYIYIQDYNEYKYKQSILGAEIINTKNNI